MGWWVYQCTLSNRIKCVDGELQHNGTEPIKFMYEFTINSWDHAKHGSNKAYCIRRQKLILFCACDDLYHLLLQRRIFIFIPFFLRALNMLRTYEQMCQFFTRRYYQFSSTFSEFSDVFVLNERCWFFVVVLARQSPCISTDG